MKIKSNPFSSLATSLLLLCLGAVAHADIEVRVSAKFIQHPNGTNPTFPAPGWSAGPQTSDITNPFGLAVEIQRANQILAATGRGYYLRLVDWLYIRPAPPEDQPDDYWYNLPARNAQSRVLVEVAASNPPTPEWALNFTAINLYINNTGSGYCTRPGEGNTILLGGTVGLGTVLHEIGHFFDLSHTHAGDLPTCPTNYPGPLNSYLSDGDNLSETIADNQCFTSNQLSQAYFNTNYLGLTPAQRATIDTAWRNVMSYHQEDQLLDIQMDYWAANANNVNRQWACSGRTWFVAPNGADLYDPDVSGWDGLEPGKPWQTLEFALNFVPPDIVRSPDDVILLNPGTYVAPTRITTACTLRATRGPVRITR